ncbi:MULTISPECIES: MFS transporter [Deefgea]|uniref:Sodium:galactoside symporter n=1 Tax=Deefgea chitinilytica TaxID=570276 RepID=A0ABS2CAA0_9NEIS|nr:MULTISPECIES: MFS transporter [Deefgea]MBM5571066.1 sodium:galactoside symporter [Deefgea chitinilytica]MBM9888296.1 MFS transporter [Deefgea sp. CFH1-16]
MKTTRPLAYASYGLLGLPLAMAALPVYVQIPAYYSGQLGLALGLTGWVLFLARLVDTLQDPLLGRWIDRLNDKITAWFWSAALILAVAFLGLWLPPVSSSNTMYLSLWLAVMLVAAYTAHSMLNIAYLTWGARIDAKAANHDQGLLGAAAWREGAGLFGVILASVIPSWIMSRPASTLSNNLLNYSLGFAAVLLIAVWVLLRFAPKWQRTKNTETVPSWRATWALMKAHQGFRQLLPPYFLNAISVAIPSTLALFFINDRLQAPSYAGAFLASYFIAAAIGLPLWVTAAKKIGVLCAWRWGMVLAILAFCSAATLGAGDIIAYLIVCIAAGLALGADLALPPVLLAKLIRQDSSPASYFGVWTLLGKLALALSGLALPALAALDYQPGSPAGPELAWVYAGVPCAFKLIAFLLLTRIKTEPAGVSS